MKTLLYSSFLLILVLVFVNTEGFAKKKSSKKPKSILIQYDGTILDEEKKPISGIFSLEFKIFNKKSGGKALWSETHFVAVENGTYSIILGKKRPIPSRLPIKRLYIAISLEDEGEIVREQLVLSDESDDHADKEKPKDKIGTKKKTQTSPQRVDFALEAEHAEDSDKLNGMEPDDLMKKILQKTGVKVSEEKHYGQAIGKDNGTKQALTCPPGEIMVGINVRTASAKLYQIQIICSPLESGGK